MGDHAVILVDSTSHALRIEKSLRQRGLVCKLIPVPRHLSSDCGVCVRISKDDMDAVRAMLAAENLPFQSVEEV